MRCVQWVNSTPLFRTQDWIPYDPTQDVIFPPDLLIKDNKTQGKDCVVFRSDRVKWFQPLTMDRLLYLKRTYPKAKMIMGNTEIGIEVKFKDQYYPVFINAKHIHQLNGLEVSDTGVHIGAAVTLSRLSFFLTKQIKEQEGYKTKILKAITEMLGWFAGIQIRNVATIGGNIVTASPISDLNPLLMAAQATLDIASVDGIRTVKVDDSFFKGYRQIDLDFKEVLTSIYIPFTQKNEHFYGFKQAQRKEDDISIVNAGMFVKFGEENNIVDDVRLAFGGMAATTVLAMNTMKDLIGSIWDQYTMDRSMKTLLEELALPPGAPGGMEQYRTSLVLGFFVKFFMKVNNDINADVQPFPSSWSSAMNDLTIKPFKSTQLYQMVSDAQNPNDPIGRPEMAMAALQQSTGEAAYVDDLPALEGELFLSLVFSSKPHADIKSLNLDDALSVNGVFDIVVASDVPGENKFGTIVVDEELYADKKVECVGQVIAGVLAKDVNIAQRAARLVKVDYEEKEPILTVEDAINKGSFLTKPVTYAVGDTETALRESDHMLEGEMKIGGQEHFYMETQCCIAIPKGEFGEMEVISSTQDVAHTQFAVASALGIPSNRVVARCKRMGGAFGGKESRACFYAALAAVAASKSKRPVRLVLDRSEDMLSSGTRHPFLAKYRIGFTKEGKIEAAEVHYYANGGHSFDFTPAVVNVACKNADNAYKTTKF
ncbi:putative xanthine dehydrogenase/oxidase-like [Apostichopus japonicus]|uniref:Putative xanthine dehydrogenase/oxidase-like n=1 Tax=Stichopus japonicus TaxID=307972 RepID=A0A2G8KFK0_STIJA|nr:putative xanthine dehydrogenase/oxidase-like [Apostichopus japonicus]